MNVSLTPHLEAMVRQKVQSGRYNNASEVVREALRLMEERDRYSALKEKPVRGSRPDGVCQSRALVLLPVLLPWRVPLSRA